MAPRLEVGLSPGDGSVADPHRAGEPILSDHAIDRRSSQAGHAHDRGKTQEGWNQQDWGSIVRT